MSYTDLTKPELRATTLAALDRLAADFEQEAAKTDTLIQALEADLEEVRRKHLPALKRQAGVVANREAALLNAVEAAPELFVKPRTMLLHGVKLGYTTSPGRIEFDDADQVIQRIERVHPDRAGEFIRTKREPNKDALRTLDAAALVKLQCRLEGEGDSVVLKRVAGDVEKIINKLIEKMVNAMTEA